jgi:hypothetical protein
MMKLSRRLSAVLGLALVVMAGSLGPQVFASPASAAGTCISSVGTHRDYYFGRDGYVSYDRLPESAVRLGVEVRQVSDCTSGGLFWIDATACLQNLDYPNIPLGSFLRASDLQSVALYGTTGTLLAANNVGAYENYRDRRGPTKICASTPRVYVGSGGNAVYAAARGAYAAIPSVVSTATEHTWAFRDTSYNSPARYRRT